MHREFAPPTGLQNTIRCFWHTRIELRKDQPSFEVVPDGYAEIIFYFGSDCSLSIDGKLQRLPSPFLVGLLNQPVDFYATNQIDVIGIRCYPWTVFDLLGLSSSQASIRVFEHPITQIQSRLQTPMQAGNVEEAISILQDYFTTTQSTMPTDSVLHKAGEALKSNKGMLTVSSVAAAAHATVRTLERKFKQSSGRTVKDVSALMRFEQARNQLWLNPQISLAGLAAELGYTDQAHLSREFKRYSGTTPAAFARKTKKTKQAFNNNFVAFVQA